MRNGKLVCLIDEHIGLGADGSSYILTPGDIGIVIQSSEDGTATLLISGDLVDVKEYSLEICDERYFKEKIK